MYFRFHILSFFSHPNGHTYAYKMRYYYLSYYRVIPAQKRPHSNLPQHNYYKLYTRKFRIFIVIRPKNSSSPATQERTEPTAKKNKNNFIGIFHCLLLLFLPLEQKERVEAKSEKKNETPKMRCVCLYLVCL